MPLKNVQEHRVWQMLNTLFHQNYECLFPWILKKIASVLWNEYTKENKSITIKTWLKGNKLLEGEKVKTKARPHATPINCCTDVTTSSEDVLPNQRPKYSWDGVLTSSSRHFCRSYAFQKWGKLVPLPKDKVGGKRDIFRACVSWQR